MTMIIKSKQFNRSATWTQWPTETLLSRASWSGKPVRPELVTSPVDVLVRRSGFDLPANLVRRPPRWPFQVLVDLDLGRREAQQVLVARNANLAAQVRQVLVGEVWLRTRFQVVIQRSVLLQQIVVKCLNACLCRLKTHSRASESSSSLATGFGWPSFLSKHGLSTPNSAARCSFLSEWPLLLATPVIVWIMQASSQTQCGYSLKTNYDVTNKGALVFLSINSSFSAKLERSIDK